MSWERSAADGQAGKLRETDLFFGIFGIFRGALLDEVKSVLRRLAGALKALGHRAAMHLLSVPVLCLSCTSTVLCCTVRYSQSWEHTISI